MDTNPVRRAQYVGAVLVGAGILTLPLTLVLPYSGSGGIVASVGSLAAAASAILAALARGRRKGTGWLLVFAGVLMWAAGDAVWTSLDVLRVSTSFPTVADGVYLAGYPVALVGLLLLHRRMLRDPVGNLLEAVILGTSVGLVLWSSLVAEHGIQTFEGALTIVYPVGDVICLVALVHLLLASGGMRLGLQLVVAGFLSFGIADVVYAAQSAHGTYAPGPWPDDLYLFTYLLVGIAAQLPSLWQEAPHPTSLPLTRRRLVVLMTGALAVIGTMVLQEALGHHNPYVFGGAGILIAAFAMWRMWLLFALQERYARELSEQQRRFTAVFESSLDGISVADDDRVYLAVNDAACRVIGLSREEIVGRRIEEVAGVPFDTVSDDWRAFLAVGEAQGERPAPDGRIIEYTAVANALPGEHLSITRDVTAQRRLEEQLRQAQKMEAIGQLAGGVAHDFNNLLMVINGYSDIALGLAPDEPRLREPLVEIRRAGERAADLTRQLLAFGRQEILQPEVIDLNLMVAEHRALLARLLGEDIVVAVKPAAEPTWVRVDPGRLSQVLVNLAANARDAMPRGGELTITTRLVDNETRSGARWAVLEVRDNGVGMDEATQARVFEPFFTTKEVGRGTGLGLAMVHGIVEQSDGFIEIVSRPGAGTTFLIHLPEAPPRTTTRHVDAALMS